MTTPSTWSTALATVTATLLLATQAVSRATDVVLVDAGQPKAVVVIAAKPSPVAALAVDELVTNIQKATGVRLEVVREPNASEAGVRVYVGDTQAARKAGIDPDTLPGESYRIKEVGGDLYILGAEDGEPLFPDGTDKDYYSAVVRGTRRGTLYGVVDFLERSVGVRWLWPGELGTYVPQTKSVAMAGGLDVTGAPAFRFRNYRVATAKRPAATGAYGNPVAGRLSFSDQGLQRYFGALSRFLLIHQAGETEPQPGVGHHFEWWWGKYGEKHPDWFAGGGPPPEGRKWGIRMCVSNPTLQQFLVDQDWDGRDWLSLGESDSRGFCRCEKCMAWDEPQPEGYTGHSTSNRYVRFAQAVHKLAVKRNPKAKIAMFLYMDYTHAPTIDADLSWAYGEFVPWGSGFQCWYPMTTAEHEADKAAWLGWSKTGMELGYRPNHLLGYTMPNLSTWQVGDMIRFAGAHGMVGFDYDSLFGQWAVKGPELYLHMRLGTNPRLTVEQVRDEYFSSFGPAAQQVQAYFDYWEHYSETKALHGGTDYGNCSKARQQYPPEAFAEGDALLAKAMEAAKTSELPEFAARVQFLQDGLKHAELAASFVGLYEARDFAEARQALLDLVAFRRSHETDFIADYTASARTECSTYRDLGDLLDGKYLVKTADGTFAIPLGDHTFRENYSRQSAKPLFPPVELKGIRPGLWSYVLGAGQEGHMIFHFGAVDGCVFRLFELMPGLGFAGKLGEGKAYNKVEVSTDGEHYDLLHENVRTYKSPRYWNISGKVQGHSEFFIRISAGFPEKDAMVCLTMNSRCSVVESVGFDAGTHTYAESFAAGEKAGELYPVEIDGFDRDKWGYMVGPDEQGHVTHRFTAADGCSFTSFRFMPWLMLPKESERTEKTYNRVEFSRDGKTYETLFENVSTHGKTGYWDLSDKVRGLNRFHIRISAGFPSARRLVYVRAAAKFEVSR